MTGSCHKCSEPIRGESVMANTNEDGIVHFCSHKCCSRFMSEEVKYSNYETKDEEDMYPWEE